jgi:hypothetical protein
VKPGDKIELLPRRRSCKTRDGGGRPRGELPADGVPRMNPYPWRMVQSIDGKYIWILFEGNIHSYRQIFLDGRHTSPIPTHLVRPFDRHWEGDTLVVDTVGYNDKFWFGATGLPHTTQAAHGRAIHAHRRRHAAVGHHDQRFQARTPSRSPCRRRAAINPDGS